MFSVPRRRPGSPQCFRQRKCQRKPGRASGDAARTRALDAYLRRVDRWAEDENALVGIGL